MLALSTGALRLFSRGISRKLRTIFSNFLCATALCLATAPAAFAQDKSGENVLLGAEGASGAVAQAAMLAAAKDFAAGDEALLGLIEDAEAEGVRGRIGGASKTLSRLLAGRTDIFKVPFYGRRLAELAIVGDGDADLDLLVTDENGNTMCVDRSYSDKRYCSWTPAWDGYFYVAVKNMGRIRNSYYILTN